MTLGLLLVGQIYLALKLSVIYLDESIFGCIRLKLMTMSCINEKKSSKKIVLSLAIAATTLFSVASYAQFGGVRWTSDTVNFPEQDRDGNGRTPSTSGATNNQGTFRFEITTTRTDTLQRQEFQFQRRTGLHRFRGEFRISSEQPNFDRVSVAQTHDDQTRSEGVFSIYQVRRADDGGYVFGVQGDTTEASNGYSTFDTVDIELDRWYRLEIRTESIDRDNTVEVAVLRDVSSGNSNEIWRETVRGGGEDEQYRKVGAYRLTNGSGRVIVDWRSMRHWTGRR